MRPNVRWLLALALGLGVLWWWLPATAQSPPKLDPNTLTQPGPVKTDPYIQKSAQAEDLAQALNAYLRAVELKTVEVTPETRQKLTRILGELYDLRQQVQLQELKALEDRLKGLKDQLATRGKERDGIIAKQADAILAGKEPPVALWLPSNLMKIEYAKPSDPKPKETVNTTPPAATTQPAPKTGTTPAGQNTPPLSRYPLDVPTTDMTIRIGLPDELIGQLLQAKTDREKALVGMAIRTRIELLETQLREAQTRLDRVLKLAETGLIDQGSVEQAKSRVDQIKVLLRAHALLQEQARP